MTSIHDVVTQSASTFSIPIFNPASNTNQVSSLRITNLAAATSSSVSISAIDDSGNSVGPVTTSVGAGSTLTLTAQDLEQGNSEKGLSTGLGDGSGKWHLSVTASEAVTLVNLLSDPNGYQTNLSSLAPASASFSLQSGDYNNGSVIPDIHACLSLRGANTSPQLQWANIPAGVQSFAIIMDDEISP